MHSHTIYVCTYVPVHKHVCVIADNASIRHDVTLQCATHTAAQAHDAWDGKTIEVRGINTLTTDEAIEMFFESKHCLFFKVNHLFIFLFTAAEIILTRGDFCLEGAPLTVRTTIEKQDAHMELSDSEQTDDSGKSCDMIIYSCLYFVPLLVRFYCVACLSRYVSTIRNERSFSIDFCNCLWLL